MDIVDPTEMFVITRKRKPNQVVERNVANAPSLTTDVGQKDRDLKWNITGWLALCIAILALTTASSPHGGWATGFHSGRGYGWPDDWLTQNVHDTTQWINGQRVPGTRTVTWSIEDWGNLMVAVAASAGIAGCCVLPFGLVHRLKKRMKESGQPGDPSNPHSPSAQGAAGR